MLKKYPHLLITLVSAFLLIPFAGMVHLFDWDEINFAEAAREMIVTGNYGRVNINFEPFWEKPPLFFWMQVASMKLFGINEFASRLPNAICGILTLNALYYYGKRLVNDNIAWLWVILYMGSFTPHFYFRSGIIDPFFNLFIFLSVMQLFYGSLEEFSVKHYFFGGFFLGLALLTKGPVAAIIVGLCVFVYMAVNRFKIYFTFGQIAILLLTSISIPLLWFLPDWISNGFWFTGEFLKYQLDLFLHPVASHGQPWYYHALVLIAACFPATIFAIPNLFSERNYNDSVVNEDVFLVFQTWMRILFWVVLVLFSLVTTKIVHYSSMCYIPVSFLGALYIEQTGGKIKAFQKILIGLFILVYTVIFSALPLIGGMASLKTELLPQIHDKFVVENIQVSTDWGGWEWVGGFLFAITAVVCLIFWYQKSALNGVKFFLLCNIAVFSFVSIAMVPKVENHVQGSIINFYERQEGRDIYMETVGFKSYAHYFYPKTQPLKPEDGLVKVTRKFCLKNHIDTKGQLTEYQRYHVNALKKIWLLKGKTDKPVYLIYKNTNTEGMDTNRNFKLLMKDGGYRVYKKLQPR